MRVIMKLFLCILGQNKFTQDGEPMFMDCFWAFSFIMEREDVKYVLWELTYKL